MHGIGSCLIRKRYKYRDMKRYRVAGYVKNALLWKKRNPEEMTAYNRAYFEKQLEGHENMELVDVYIDITGNKETYKRPEMVRMIRDVIDGRVNLIYSRTSAYIAANANELCMLMKFLFEQSEMVDLYTEDPVYQFNTIDNIDNQLQELKRMSNAYCVLFHDEYQDWKHKLQEQLAKIE